MLRELLAVLNACWLGHAGATEEAEGGGGAALREAGFVVQVLNTLTGEEALRAGRGLKPHRPVCPKCGVSFRHTAQCICDASCLIACDTQPPSPPLCPRDHHRDLRYLPQASSCQVYRGSPPNAGAGRFSLTVKLLGGSSKPVLAELFASLEAAAAAAEAAADAGEQGAGESVASGLCSLEQLAAVKALYGLKAGG